MDNNTEKEIRSEETTEETTPEKKSGNILGEIYELCEMLGVVTICVMLIFAFFVRLNVVDGHSMDKTLAHGQYLVVSDFLYDPTPGDIVVVHDITATPYDKPIVKRVIATEGQVVDIDFSTWTLTVDGEVVEESYRWLDPARMPLTAEYSFPITVPEGEIFVLGDNRHNSADSRQSEIGTIDERCVVGKAYMRVFPFGEFEVFKNPYSK
ncbi:MAG: signal peptidase I [Clostridia bacterium]|nr:signal peptidase I [Clostridia bacterium]